MAPTLHEILAWFSTQQVRNREQVVAWIHAAPQLPLEQRMFIELLGRCQFPDDGEIHTLLEQIGNPAIDPVQLSERLALVVSNPLDVQAELFALIGTERAWIEEHKSPVTSKERAVSRGRLELGVLAKLVAQARASQASAIKQINALYGLWTGAPTRPLAEACDKLSWLHKMCQPVHTRRGILTGAQGIVGRAIEVAKQPAIACGVAAGVAVVCLAAAVWFTRHGSPTVLDELTVGLADAGTVAKLSPDPRQPFVVFVMADREAPKIEQIFNRLPNAVLIARRNVCDLPEVLPRGTQWLGMGDLTRYIPAELKDARVFVVTLATCDGGQQIAIEMVRPYAATALSFVGAPIARLGNATPAYYLAQISSTAKWDAKVDRLLRLAGASAATDDERAQVWLAEAEARRNAGGTENEARAAHLLADAQSYLRRSN